MTVKIIYDHIRVTPNSDTKKALPEKYVFKMLNSKETLQKTITMCFQLHNVGMISLFIFSRIVRNTPCIDVQ